MKFYSKLALGVLALSLANQAVADVTVNLTGSTAFRSVIHASVQSMMGGAGTTRIAHNHASALNSASLTIFRGPVAGLGTVTVRCSWSGSATGIRDCAQQNDLSFLRDTTLPASAGINAGQSSTELGKAQIAMSDVYQSSTIYTSPSLQNNNVAVVPFVWVANESAPAGLTNVTSQMGRALLSNGIQPLSLFTGSAGDAGTLVYPTGRDGGSGTRITALAEIKYGIFNNVQQWTAVSDNTAGTVTSLQIWPTTGTGSDPAQAGNGGYTSGGTVATLMGNTSASVDTLDETGGVIDSDQPVVIITYLGTGDAATASGLGAKQLAYDGVSYSVANVQNGSYTFWGYQHLYNKSGLTTDENTFKNSLISVIPSNLGSAGIALGSMQVSRTSDGGLVGP